MDADSCGVMLVALLSAIAILLGAIALLQAARLRRLEADLADALRSSRVEAETALRNRHAFIEDLELEVMRSARSGQPVSLLILSFGDPVQADATPNKLVGILRSTLRSVDVSYRIAPDEFAVIVPNTRARGGLVAARRIEERLLESGCRRGSFTAGVSEAGPGIDRHQLFRHAYCAYLAAGRDGRFTTLAYSPELEAGAGDDELARLAEIEPVDGRIA